MRLKQLRRLSTLKVSKMLKDRSGFSASIKKDEAKFYVEVTQVLALKGASLENLTDSTLKRVSGLDLATCL